MKRFPSWSTRPARHHHRTRRHSLIEHLEPRHLLAAGDLDLTFGDFDAVTGIPSGILTVGSRRQ